MTITTSPWGPVQHVTELADGITQVMTASHGGIKLSPARLEAMPEAERTSDGWYEEDCEAAYVLRHFFNAEVITLPPDQWRAVMNMCSVFGDFARIRMAHH